VINSPSLAAQQHGQRRVVRELFEIFFEASDANRYMLPRLVGNSSEWRATSAHIPRGRFEQEMAADVVCSLSEQTGDRPSQRVTGVDPGSVLTGFMP
jgi:hypothetical protein